MVSLHRRNNLRAEPTPRLTISARAAGYALRKRVLFTLLICALSWDHVPYASTRRLDVACSSWNQVHMAMMNGLACRFTHVDTHIEPGDGGILCLRSALCLD